MIRNLRSIISKSRLRKSLVKVNRKRAMINLADARRIGIIYVLNDTLDYDTVSGFVTELQRQHKEVKALGFVRNKDLIGRFLPKLSYDFFSRKDVTWFNVPVQKRVKDFTETEFDLLIDLSLKEMIPVQYVAGHSRAQCRVGRFTEENTCCYDFMINLNPAATLDEFIKQIIYYLTVINKNAEPSVNA
ncbi:MAG: hypothetical protein Q8867_00635 [Bacteroidota bacterium]|nr:hypothetical protein [Bacteroidota bacterium]